MRWPWQRRTVEQGPAVFVLVPEDYWARIAAKLDYAADMWALKNAEDVRIACALALMSDLTQLRGDIVAMRIGEMKL